ncbi:MAG: citrate/2-methylcitrate synthase [Candidatus Omnitrophica bacterium]|nr:citrate/2-methylcitrate synthase [Candidatus Omnitrophota bacterium]
MKHVKTKKITKLIVDAEKKAHKETKGDIEPAFAAPVKWPVDCVVGPGLEGAIACESKIGYVNGSKGELIYQGYNIFDLCAYSTFEEVSYLLLHGNLPTKPQLSSFNEKLIEYRNIPNTIGTLMGFPIRTMSAMAALRAGTNFMRYECTYADSPDYIPDRSKIISADEDSIPMETIPMGEEHAIYEFKKGVKESKDAGLDLHPPEGYPACYHLISGVSSVAGAVARIRQGFLPIAFDPELSHAANLIYMITGKKPTPVEERVMDVALILHADHGMNASTFATMVVASTLSDIYLAMGSGIAALSGPLHGGANEEVLKMLEEIGSVSNVASWYKHARAKKKKIMGFGHRVYRAYDPRARVLGPLAEHLVNEGGDAQAKTMLSIAKALEKEVISTLGAKKGIFPNVDFYSGIVYSCLGIPPDFFTPIFAVSRAAGWTARVMEYLKHNRIFRPRAMYVGSFDRKYKQSAGKDKKLKKK